MPTTLPPTQPKTPRSGRPTCAACQRPLNTCLCHWVRPTHNTAELLVLMHPLEQHQAKGSVPLLRQSLARCQCEVGEAFDPATLQAWLTAPTAAGPVHCWLLYPDEPGSVAGVALQRAPGRALLPSPGEPANSATPPEAQASRIAQPKPALHRLVLLDGTWRKTRKMLHLNPLLLALPRWPLANPPPPRYSIRRAQRPEQRSSLEAACLALGALEGDTTRYAPLLQAFEGWVAEQAARAGSPPFKPPFTPA